MTAPLPPLRLALAQIDSRVGDLEGNAALIRENIAAAREGGAELVLFPELAMTGYPPEDLLLKEHFLRAARASIWASARRRGVRRPAMRPDVVRRGRASARPRPATPR